MIKQFNEIVDFFKNDSFSEVELDQLRSELRNKYNEKQVLDAAFTLVELELLKFKLLSESNIDEKKESKPAPKGFINNENSKIIIDIESLANRLDVRPGFILSLLKQKGFNKSEGNHLNATEFNTIKEFVKSREKALQRKKKKEDFVLSPRLQRNRKHDPKASKHIGVYDKIATHGLGKIIYIRRK